MANVDIATTFHKFKVWYAWASQVDTVKKVGQWSFWIGVWFTAYLSTGISINPFDLQFSTLGTIISSFHNVLVSGIWHIIGYGLLAWSIYMIVKTVWRIREHGIIGYIVSMASFLILPTIFFYGKNQLVVWVAVGSIIVFALSQKYG